MEGEKEGEKRREEGGRKEGRNKMSLEELACQEVMKCSKKNNNYRGLPQGHRASLNRLPLAKSGTI